MKKTALSALLLFPVIALAQNVAINSTGATAVTSAALDVDMTNKGILIPRVALTTTAAFAPVTGTPATSLMVYNTATAGAGATAVSPGYYYWDGAQWVRLLSGAASATNNWIVGTAAGNVNAPGAVGFLGTTDANHLDLVTGGVVRGRLSNSGEFFIGTTATALTGDLMNGVGNAAFPWAINGYTNQNAAAIYGLRQNGSTGAWGSVQGETGTTIPANNSGISGLAAATNHRGVIGQKPAGGLGWGGLFLNDLGYTGFFGAASDRNVKRNIRPITHAVEHLKRLQGTTYEYTLPFLGAGTHYGFIAQNVEEVFPEMVQEKNFQPVDSRSFGQEIADGEAYRIKAVSTVSLIPVLVEAVKEQQITIDRQQATIDVLIKRIEVLEKR
jgi:hypothetical protein